MAAIAPAWDRLLLRSPCNRAFGCARWFLGSVAAARPSLTHVITAWRGSELAGVLPLVVLDDSTTALIPNLLCDYQDIVAPAGDEAVATGLLRRAIAPAAPYRQLKFDWLRSDSNAVSAMRQLDPGYRFVPGHGNYVCPYLRLPPDYHAYQAGKSPKSRHRLGYYRRRAERLGCSLIRLPNDDFSPARTTTEFLALHFDRFGADSGLSPGRFVSFIQDVLPGLLAEGKAEALALGRDNRLLAIEIYFLGQRSYCSWNGGFAPAARDLQVGTLLVDAGIRRACELGLEEYDFLAGPETYKYRWATDSRPLGQLVLTVSA